MDRPRESVLAKGLSAGSHYQPSAVNANKHSDDPSPQPLSLPAQVQTFRAKASHPHCVWSEFLTHGNYEIIDDDDDDGGDCFQPEWSYLLHSHTEPIHLLTRRFLEQVSQTLLFVLSPLASCFLKEGSCNLGRKKTVVTPSSRQRRPCDHFTMNLKTSH